MKKCMLLIIIILKNITSLNTIATTAASTSFGTGFYGSAFESFKTNQTTKISKEAESNLTSNGGNINIVSKKKI